MEIRRHQWGNTQKEHVMAIVWLNVEASNYSCGSDSLIKLVMSKVTEVSD